MYPSIWWCMQYAPHIVYVLYISVYYIPICKLSTLLWTKVLWKVKLRRRCNVRSEKVKCTLYEEFIIMVTRATEKKIQSFFCATKILIFKHHWVIVSRNKEKFKDKFFFHNNFTTFGEIWMQMDARREEWNTSYKKADY